MNKDQEELLLDILKSLNSTQDHQVELRIKRLREAFHLTHQMTEWPTQLTTTPAMINAPPTHDPNEQLQAATTVQTLNQKLARRSKVTF